MTITKRYLHLPTRPGGSRHRVTVLVDGEAVLRFDAELADGAAQLMAPIDLAAWVGRQVELRLDPPAPEPPALVRLVAADEPLGAEQLYREALRPQYHFTAQRGWLNDPNGLAWYRGEYHLFFQHNPYGVNWGNMHWGHAVSDDLVHWTEVAEALAPDEFGTMFSGSAVVDTADTSGLGAGEVPLVLLYTAAGEPFTQCLAWTTDGRTVHKLADNPVVPNLNTSNRDPKVFWHEPTGRWIMALYVPVPPAPGTDQEGHSIQLLWSADLKSWAHLDTVPDFYECPDLFELPVIDEPGESRWMLFGANGEYQLGRFDGHRFTAEGPRRRLDHGRHYYAAQTFSDLPAEDGRRILIGWMNGGSYPDMPFNQQMTFPTELTLERVGGELVVRRLPVREIEALHEAGYGWSDTVIAPGGNPFVDLAGELWDLELTIAPEQAAAVTLAVRGEPICFDAVAGTLSCLERSVNVAPGRPLNLRVLVDRTSLEVFVNHGEAVMSSCFLPPADDRGLGLTAEGGAARLLWADVHALGSAWPR